MDEWQTPSGNNTIIIIVIILIIVGIIILIIAIWVSGTSNNSNSSSQQMDAMDDDDDNSSFDSGSTSTKDNSNNTKHSVTTLHSGQIKLTPVKPNKISANNANPGTTTNPKLVTPNVTSNAQVLPENPIINSQAEISTQSIIPADSEPKNIMQITSDKSEIPINDNDDGDSIPSIGSDSNVIQAKDESIPKISESEIKYDNNELHPKETPSPTEDDDSTNSSINISMESSSGSPEQSDLEELARQEDLASVEDITAYESELSQNESPSINVVKSQSSMPKNIIVDMNASQNQKSIKEEITSKPVISSSLQVKSKPIAIPQINTSSQIKSETIVLPRPIIPRPIKINPYVPLVTANGNGNMDETSGFSVDASVTNPASLSSNFSSLTDKSVRPQRRRKNTDPLKELTNLPKITKGRGSSNNPHMGPFQ